MLGARFQAMFNFTLTMGDADYYFVFRKDYNRKYSMQDFVLLRYCCFDLFYTNSSLLPIFGNFFVVFKKNYDMIRYHTDSSSSQKHCVIAFLKVLPKRFT